MTEAAKIDRSLNDIIKERGISGRLPRGGGTARGGGAARGGPARGGYGRVPNGRGGAVQKRRSLPNSPRGYAAANNQWNHDLYQNGARTAVSPAAAAGPAKLVISNLDFGVNDTDIKGLFQEYGVLRKAAVHYDRSGRSLGTADVVFERRPDAIRALKKYNGVSLDGRPMDIQLVTPLKEVRVAAPPGATGSPLAPRRMSGPPFRGASRGFAPRGAPRRGAPGGRGGRGAKQPTKSLADLDADLDAYNAKMQTE